MDLTAAQWLERYAAALGLATPEPDEVEAVLALAGTAAHASERPAAPVSAWLAARAGLPPAEALEAARRLAAELDGED